MSLPKIDFGPEPILEQFKVIKSINSDSLAHDSLNFWLSNRFLCSNKLYIKGLKSEEYANCIMKNAPLDNATFFDKFAAFCTQLFCEQHNRNNSKNYKSFLVHIKGCPQLNNLNFLIISGIVFDWN